MRIIVAILMIAPLLVLSRFEDREKRSYMIDLNEPIRT